MQPIKKTNGQNIDLITYLNKLLDYNWKFNLKDQTNAFLTNIDNDIANVDKKDLYKVLISRFFNTNTCTQIDYALTTQLDIEKPKSYNKAM